MSTVLPPESGLEPDPYRYGYRYVRRRQPDGTETSEMIPLTLFDVLHPQEDDHVMENSRHERHRRYFQDVFEKRLSRQPTLLSLSDCRIDWDRPDLLPHGPDLIVLERDEPWPWRSWSTLHVKQEHARPLLIVELTSPATRRNDLVEKVEHYHRVGVPLYVIVDSEREEGPLKLLGYRHEPPGYALLSPDERGRLLLEPFGLYLAVTGERVAIFDAVTETELGDYVAVCEALEAEIRARQAAEQRARRETRARRAAARREQEQTEARQAAEEARRAAERHASEQTEARRAAEEARQAAERHASEQTEARRAAEEARRAAERHASEQTEARRAAERREQEQTEARQAAERHAEELTRARQAADQAQAEMATRLKQLAEELQRLRGG